MAKKGRKNKRSSFLCSFGGCFGFSTKVSADHGDGKPVSGKQQRGAPTEMVGSSKEIHVVEDDEDKRLLSPAADELIVTNKTDDTTSEKSKKGEEYSPTRKRGHDTWTKQRKLSHSVSLPLPQDKTAAAVDGENKGEEVAVGGEFDSMFGAVIILMTLIVMVIWGKVCAILCTAAWFYLVPRLRANLDRSYAIKFKNAETDRFRVDSAEHKKMVVLQGLLHRNRPQ